MEQSELRVAEPLSYAAPPAAYGHKVWAGIVITFAGLGLIFLGGCFLIGVLAITSNSDSGKPLPPESITLMIVLYILAAIAFASAAWVLFKGLTALFRVLRS